MADVSVQVKMQILQNEMQLWQNTRYQAEVRARVGKRADNKQYEEAALKELEQCEKMIDALEAELEGLMPKATKKAKNASPDSDTPA